MWGRSKSGTSNPVKIGPVLPYYCQFPGAFGGLYPHFAISRAQKPQFQELAQVLPALGHITKIRLSDKKSIFTIDKRSSIY